MIRFTILSLFATMAWLFATLVTLQAHSDAAVSLFFAFALGCLSLAVIVAALGQGRRRAFAVGFAVAGWGYLLTAFACSHSPRWDDVLLTQPLALKLFVQLQRTQEDQLHAIANTLDCAVALAAGWLGGTMGLIAARRRTNSGTTA